MIRVTKNWRQVVAIAICLAGITAIFAQKEKEEYYEDPCWSCYGQGTKIEYCACGGNEGCYKCGGSGSYTANCSVCGGSGTVRKSRWVKDDGKSSSSSRASDDDDESPDTPAEKEINLEDAIRVLDDVLKELFR